MVGRSSVIIISSVVVLALLAIGGLFIVKLRSAPAENDIAAVVGLENKDDDSTTLYAQQRITDRRRTNLLAEFDLTNLRVDEDELIQGTTKKDQIIAVVDPDHSPIDSINELGGDERMIAVTIEGETVGYPFSILAIREIINDRIAGTPIAVMY